MDAKLDGRAANEPRAEDDVLVRGHGCYAADAPLPAQAYAYFVRSPHAFANIVGVDVTAALDAGGVLGVLTAKDMDGVGSLGRHPPLAGRGGKGFDPAAPAGFGRRTGNACRRTGRDGRRRERGRGARRRRTGRGRIPTTHTGDRCTRGTRPRRAASLATSAGQPCGGLAGARRRSGRQHAPSR